jgi:hypothetical protein
VDEDDSVVEAEVEAELVTVVTVVTTDEVELVEELSEVVVSIAEVEVSAADDVATLVVLEASPVPWNSNVSL